VPAPPLPEQTEIETALRSTDGELAAEEDRKSALESLFKTIRHLLMTGQVRVDAWDIAQEPQRGAA